MLKNKKELKEEFDKYVSDYDMADDMISYKYYHTFRVADNAEKIAESLNMSVEEIEIAYLCGLLHDIGRFYQVKNYKTYEDRAINNFDHGDLGYKVLSEGLIRRFIDTDKYDNIIFEAVRNHNKMKIDYSKDYNELTLKYIKITRDADKLDIFSVIASKETVINYDNFEDGGITPEIIQDFKDRKIVDYNRLRTQVDKAVVYLGYVYDIYFDYTFDCIIKNDYLKKYVDALNVDKDTRKVLDDLCVDAYKYINERILNG